MPEKDTVYRIYKNMYNSKIIMKQPEMIGPGLEQILT